MSINELRKNAALREKHRPKFEANFKTRFIPVYHKKLERLDWEGKYSDAQTQQQFDAYIEGFKSAVTKLVEEPAIQVIKLSDYQKAALQRSCKHSDMIITIEGATGNGKDVYEATIEALLNKDSSLKYDKVSILSHTRIPCNLLHNFQT